jgi:peptide-methionine (S)-S-oxide reductase
MSRLAAAALAVGAAAALALQLSPAALAKTGALVPAPRTDVPRASGLQTAVLAGGCFWGLEAVFERVRGVRSVSIFR